MWDVPLEPQLMERTTLADFGRYLVVALVVPLVGQLIRRLGLWIGDKVERGLHIVLHFEGKERRITEEEIGFLNGYIDSVAASSCIMYGPHKCAPEVTRSGIVVSCATQSQCSPSLLSFQKGGISSPTGNRTLKLRRAMFWEKKKKKKKKKSTLR
eukprot:Trichotokara_eunicae@DN3607_c0_g1_i4.p1